MKKPFVTLSYLQDSQLPQTFHLLPPSVSGISRPWLFRQRKPANRWGENGAAEASESRRRWTRGVDVSSKESVLRRLRGLEGVAWERRMFWGGPSWVEMMPGVNLVGRFVVESFCS